MALTPTEADMISAAIESALIDVHVALPASVQSYDAATQTATIELQVQRVLPKGTGFVTEDLPVLENVPVMFPRTKTFVLSFPVAAGDFGLVVFSEMSIDQWRSKGASTSPGDIGRHTLSGGVFQPGLMPNSEANDDPALGADLVLGEIAGVQVRIKPGGVAEVVSAGGPTADDFVGMAGKILARLDTIQQAHDTHQHTTTATISTGSPGVITVPTSTIGQLDGVASTNLKADGVDPE